MVKEPINILVANNHLFNVGGSETFTYSLIEELNKRENINVEYFTFEKGFVSDKIEQELGVYFYSKKKYDLILASHNTCVEELYSRGFIIQICHGIFPPIEQPSFRANGYVSISQEVQSYLCSLGFSSKIILNGINLNRFKPEKPTSKELQTVLSLCQSEKANDFIKKSCDLLNLNFIKANKFVESVWEIEKLINRSDLVIGLGRSAYDAMACGRPVIIYDYRRYLGSLGDGYIKNTLGLSIQNNCSGRYFNYKFSIDNFIIELKKYSIADGEYFRNFAVRELDISNSVNQYLTYWNDLIKANRRLRYYKVQSIIGVKCFNFMINIYSKIVSLLRL